MQEMQARAELLGEFIGGPQCGLTGAASVDWNQNRTELIRFVHLARMG